jgi:hypothetical protein
MTIAEPPFASRACWASGAILAVPRSNEAGKTATV